jgi:predicted nucleic acid-binding protein
MEYKVFVDSDVVIDFFTDREPHANPASELFELNEQGIIKMYISAVSINNIYYIVRRFLGHKKTIEVVETLIEMTEIIGTTKNEIVQALKNDFSDYEDSVQYSSALNIKDLKTIITRNTKEYRNSSIAVMTPLNFLKMREKNDS